MPHLTPFLDVKSHGMNGNVRNRTDQINLFQSAKPGEENGAPSGALSPDGGAQLTECSATDVSPGATVNITLPYS